MHQRVILHALSPRERPLRHTARIEGRQHAITLRASGEHTSSRIARVRSFDDLGLCSLHLDTLPLAKPVG